MRSQINGRCRFFALVPKNLLMISILLAWLSQCCTSGFIHPTPNSRAPPRRQAPCGAQTRITHSYPALHKWDSMGLSLAQFTYWGIVNSTVQRTTSFFFMSAQWHFPGKWPHIYFIRSLLLGLCTISGLQYSNSIALNIPVPRYLPIWTMCFWG